MAANLLGRPRGHGLQPHGEQSATLVEQGAHRAAQIADACRGEAVITMLADDGAVEGAVFGDAGVISSLRPGGIHISLSTISVALQKRSPRRMPRPSSASCPHRCSDGPKRRRRGSSLSQSPALRMRWTPACLSSRRSDRGRFLSASKPSAANLVKVSGNFLISSMIEALGEAMALVGKAGVDQHHYIDFLTSTLFNAPVYKTYGGLIAEKKFQPAGFAAPLGFKDNRLVLAAAETLQVPMPLASLIYNRFLTLLARGGESLDWSAFSQLAAEDSGQPALKGLK